MSSSTCQIPANPDVSGIGIRLGLYITSFLVAAIPEPAKPHYGYGRLRSTLRNAAMLNAFALAVTAVIQTGNSDL